MEMVSYVLAILSLFTLVKMCTDENMVMNYSVFKVLLRFCYLKTVFLHTVEEK